MLLMPLSNYGIAPSLQNSICPFAFCLKYKEQRRTNGSSFKKLVPVAKGNLYAVLTSNGPRDVNDLKATYTKYELEDFFKISTEKKKKPCKFSYRFLNIPKDVQDKGA